MSVDLPLIWAGLIATAVALYVLLDGFDLGVGILFPFASPEERDVMVNSIAPVWDGNETWLVLGGGGLFAAFPLAYAILMPALYLPIGVMLTALIFRGVAFEFRAHGRKSGRKWWTLAFSAGSMIAAVAQGFILGGFLQGVTVDGRSFAGGGFDWVSPYGALIAAGLVTGYALLGACWLIFKAKGDLQARARRWAMRLILAVSGLMAAVSIATLFVNPDITARWGISLSGGFDIGQFLLVSPAPLAAAIAATGVFLWARKGPDLAPYLAAVVLYLSGFAGLAISLFPNVVPFDITYVEAAARDNALGLMLAGTVVLLPLILGYTGYVYWLFRGKATGGSYH
ncbi:cytochrome d ubiquinol oxidase subunit II [Hyphobacterium marinum]|uniref:Cytochrome d ubiquinol oxidase subunit II n=1 Tax=Hyphobacterium marinum TaxID=3116574 RepID=A0ABU7LZP8_9PROT|nr:cytochrome d ubiquinol oxidase subunit II [Hyphobacterium sp. Y6023]MEE2567042.1 cytochrome d ubiquinol oxidase subunit II [Hyphobacterium sp. Y6023]